MSGYAPLSLCGPACLPAPGLVTRAPAWLRAARYLALLVLMTTMPLVFTRWRRVWFGGLVRASGVRTVLHGGPPPVPGPVGTLVVANHVSWLDIPVLLAQADLGVLGKSDVRAWPVIGSVAARTGTVFIDRRRLRLLPRTVADLAANLRRGRSMLVFPEGTTWCGPMSGRFFPATLQAALDADAPVRPVRLTYRVAGGGATTVAGFLGDETLWTSVRRVVSARGLVVEVDVRSAAGLPRDDRRVLARAAAESVLGPAAPPRPASVRLEFAPFDTAHQFMPVGAVDPQYRPRPVLGVSHQNVIAEHGDLHAVGRPIGASGALSPGDLKVG